jgi:hypothetical protein
MEEEVGVSEKVYYKETEKIFNAKSARTMSNNAIKKMIDDDFSKNIPKIAKIGGTSYSVTFHNDLDIAECMRYVLELGFIIKNISGVSTGVKFTICW